jgi:hypothetical protein
MPLLTTQSAKGYGFGTAIAGPTETNAYWALADLTVSANTSSVQITSIPTTGYTHLEIRGVWTNNQTGSSGLKFTLNNDTGANYFTHYTYGQGDNLSAGNYHTSLQNNAWAAYFGTTADGSYDATSFVLKIPDYTSTTKKRSFQSIEGRANTASPGNHGEINHGVYITTGSAITSIEFSTSTGLIGANSRFSIYGIKG